MQIYKDMYYNLFNAVTDAVELLPDKPEDARLLLCLAQVKCEKMFMECDEEEN